MVPRRKWWQGSNMEIQGMLMRARREDRSIQSHIKTQASTTGLRIVADHMAMDLGRGGSKYLDMTYIICDGLTEANHISIVQVSWSRERTLAVEYDGSV